MREEYDFSQSVPNPYLKKLGSQVTLAVDESVIAYFKSLSEENGIPYQNLMGLYLKDCVETQRKLSLTWEN